jgi:hypothetical protein
MGHEENCIMRNFITCIFREVKSEFSVQGKLISSHVPLIRRERNKGF